MKARERVGSDPILTHHHSILLCSATSWGRTFLWGTTQISPLTLEGDQLTITPLIQENDSHYRRFGILNKLCSEWNGTQTVNRNRNGIFYTYLLG